MRKKLNVLNQDVPFFMRRNTLSLLRFTVLFLLILQSGCRMYDPIIKEMDSAYAKRESDEDVTKVVQKYFPVGAEFEKVIPLLNELKDDGFEVSEIQNGAVHLWPNGEFHLEGDKLDQLNMKRRYPVGTKGFSLSKRYDIQRVIVIKTAVIRFKVEVTGKLSEVEGNIYVTSGI